MKKLEYLFQGAREFTKVSGDPGDYDTYTFHLATPNGMGALDSTGNQIAIVVHWNDPTTPDKIFTNPTEKQLNSIPQIGKKSAQMISEALRGKPPVVKG